MGTASVWAAVALWLVPEAGAQAVSGNLVGNVQVAGGGISDCNSQCCVGSGDNPEAICGSKAGPVQLTVELLF
ncbi:MAG: hypothetical protein EBY17_13570 [Acidobacteriia bacterium]|nr:hypothetical protein [Terriglobia bacterium]